MDGFQFCHFECLVFECSTFEITVLEDPALGCSREAMAPL